MRVLKMAAAAGLAAAMVMSTVMYSYADPGQPSGWQIVDGDKWVHYNERGTRDQGWVKIDNERYLFLKDGIMATSGNWQGGYISPTEGKLTFDRISYENGEIIYIRANAEGIPAPVGQVIAVGEDGIRYIGQTGWKNELLKRMAQNMAADFEVHKISYPVPGDWQTQIPGWVLTGELNELCRCMWGSIPGTTWRAEWYAQDGGMCIPAVQLIRLEDTSAPLQ